MKAFVLGGGSMVKETSNFLLRYLQEDGFETVYSEEAQQFQESVFANSELLVLNSCLWTGSGHSMDEASRKALVSHFEQGKGAVVMHSSIGNWNDWPKYIDYVGGVWDWEHSRHSAPDSTFEIEQVANHPILEGVPDRFEVTDEMYYNLRLAADNEVLATTSSEFGSHPMVWVRQAGRSRVPAIMIGHDERAVSHPQYIQLFRNACKWTLGGLYV